MGTWRCVVEEGGGSLAMFEERDLCGHENVVGKIPLAMPPPLSRGYAEEQRPHNTTELRGRSFESAYGGYGVTHHEYDLLRRWNLLEEAAQPTEALV